MKNMTARGGWYEAQANFCGDTKTVYVFYMRSMASGCALHCAYLHATQQALLEAHELAFAWFGGVFATIRYDNLRASAKKLCGARRKETARFLAFRSHWGFDAHFCDPFEKHDLDTLEGERGYFRSNHPAAVSRIRDLADLNRQLRTGCQQNAQRRIEHGTATSDFSMPWERERLQPLPRRGFDLAELSFPTVVSGGFVKVSTNRYSTPLKQGMQTEVRAHPAYVDVWHNGHLVARHERSYGHRQQIFTPEHDAEPMSNNHSALTGSAAVAA